MTAMQHDTDCHCEDTEHPRLIQPPLQGMPTPRGATDASAPVKNLRSIIRDLLTTGSLESRVENLNALRETISDYSPFNTEPVDFVRWVKSGNVHANDYNPNKVAPPEMELLRLSISRDGYTQPIVAMEDEVGDIEVIDGFHRHRVGKEVPEVQERIHGYLPIVQIRDAQTGKNDRIASTIRHNRARGKHMVQAMSDIVIELKRRNWSEDRIGKELGMDPDEVLRLCQITGLAELFQDERFSRAWDIEAEIRDEDALEETYAALTTDGES